MLADFSFFFFIITFARAWTSSTRFLQACESMTVSRHVAHHRGGGRGSQPQVRFCNWQVWRCDTARTHIAVRRDATRYAYSTLHPLANTRQISRGRARARAIVFLRSLLETTCVSPRARTRCLRRGPVSFRISSRWIKRNETIALA